MSGTLYQSIPLGFGRELRAHLAANFATFSARQVERSELKRAAVSIVIMRSDRDPAANAIRWDKGQSTEAAIVITRRAAKMKKHAGQWALPGGRLDEGETAIQTALRELEEEVSLTLVPNDLITRLDDYPTRSGFVISPFVFWCPRDQELVANPDEVASIHRVPLRELLREDSPILEDGPEPERPVLRIPLGDSWIAAPTAAVLYQFRQTGLLGKPMRVDHFEQPRFAWR